jgi:hypothetical protein
MTGDNSGGTIAVYTIISRSGSYQIYYVQRIGPEGDFLWGEKGILLGSFYGSGYASDYRGAISDSSGGVIVVWADSYRLVPWRPPHLQTYVAKIDSEGNVQWRRTIPGVEGAIPDGSGGVIIAYTDPYDNMSVLKINTEGNLPWGGGGVSLDLGECAAFDIASDNLGGIIVVGETFRGGDYIACAQRVDSEGNILWQTGGVQICTGPVEGAQVVNTCGTYHVRMALVSVIQISMPRG